MILNHHLPTIEFEILVPTGYVKFLLIVEQNVCLYDLQFCLTVVLFTRVKTLNLLTRTFFDNLILNVFFIVEKDAVNGIKYVVLATLAWLILCVAIALIITIVGVFM